MTRLRGLAPLLVAAALTAVAVATVERAGCDEPARYERSGNGYVLIGGCIAPGDIVVPEPVQPASTTTSTDAPAKS
jgi:hypothetical protein